MCLGVAFSLHVWLNTLFESVLLLAGFCDFEMDLCGWVNSPPAESGVDWDWLSGKSSGRFLPNSDHSTNSALGRSPHTWFNYLHASECGTQQDTK